MRNSMSQRFSSFSFLNFTQFLGALNDNIYKMLIVFFLIQVQGVDKSSQILGLTGALFVIPFLLLASTAGTLADRYSKNRIIVLTKVIELVAMVAGVLFFLLENSIGAYVVLFLLGCQSALFSPSKYGIVPELVEREEISKANGVLTFATFFAIILGTFLASFMTGITNRNFVLASLFCIIIAIVGLITSLRIRHTPPSGSSKKVTTKFISEIFRTVGEAKKIPALRSTIFGSAFFLFVGGFVQLNIIPFSISALNLTDVEGGYLFLITAIGIGLGSYLAGRISGKSVQLGLVPIGGFGISLCCFFLNVFASELYAVIPLLLLLGFSAGFYQVPLDSYIQTMSPNQKRGQIIACSSFLSFVGVLIASGSVYFINDVLKLQPSQGFAIIGLLALVVAGVFTRKFFDQLTHTVAKLLGFLHFRISLYGRENVPSNPAVYICTHTAWNDTLLLLQAQSNRMRFFIEEEQPHHKWLKKLYGLLHIELDPLSVAPHKVSSEAQEDTYDVESIKSTLEKGISVCLFITGTDLEQEIKKHRYAHAFRKILAETPYPVIPALIEKEHKKVKAPFFASLWKRFRVPATVAFGKIVTKEG